MTSEAQRIAIAQFLFPDFEWFDNGLRWRNPENGNEGQGQDYPFDLNAMHEAEMVLTDEQYLQFDMCLDAISVRLGFKSWRSSSSPADQRAEAFLRTLGLWK